MANLHQVLAPLIEPPLSNGTVTEVAAPMLLWVVAAGILLALLLLVTAWLWRRRAPVRALKRIARQSDPIQAAHQLAQLVKQLGKPAPNDWLATLAHVRFGPPAAEHAATLPRLCAEAHEFIQAR
jgi:HAMP domain-containing protein